MIKTAPQKQCMSPDDLRIVLESQRDHKASEPEIAEASLIILKQRADHAESMAILAKNGLRPLTYQEALSRSSELIKELEGKWFYLAGEGLNKKDKIYTFDNQGGLAELAGNETRDQKVRVWSGDQPLYLYVNSDPIGGRRFDLAADESPPDIAPVVVGVKIDEVLPQIRRKG